MNEDFAVYEPMLPLGWFGDRPADYQPSHRMGAPMPDSWLEVVVDQKLTCGVRVTIERGGFTVYDVRGWADGMPTYPRGTPRTVKQAAEVELPALVRRLRLVNAHLSLLHGASMFHHKESPPVVRVRASDLFHYSPGDDESVDGWFRDGHLRLERVGVADIRRFSGAMSPIVIETSLAWLDTVVTSNQLIDFDRLNQGQDALGTHDFSTALGSLWQVCEARLHKLATHHGVQVKERIQVWELCQLLESRQVLDGVLKQRLDNVRKERNHLIHKSVEPSAEIAHECLDLAATLLRAVVPDLTVRGPMHLFLM